MSRSSFVDSGSPDRIERSRTWINANGAAMLVLAAACILLAMFTVRAELGEKPKPPYVAWYYDTVTGRYFEGEPLALAPIQSPAGNEAVRVVFYRCAECDESEPLLRMFAKYDADALAYYHKVCREDASDEELEIASEMLEENRLVSFDAIEWTLEYDLDDPEEALSRQCAGGAMIYVPSPR